MVEISQPSSIARSATARLILSCMLVLLSFLALTKYPAFYYGSKGLSVEQGAVLQNWMYAGAILGAFVTLLFHGRPAARWLVLLAMPLYVGGFFMLLGADTAARAYAGGMALGLLSAVIFAVQYRELCVQTRARWNLALVFLVPLAFPFAAVGSVLATLSAGHIALFLIVLIAILGSLLGLKQPRLEDEPARSDGAVTPRSKVALGWLAFALLLAALLPLREYYILILNDRTDLGQMEISRIAMYPSYAYAAGLIVLSPALLSLCQTPRAVYLSLAVLSLAGCLVSASVLFFETLYAMQVLAILVNLMFGCGLGLTFWYAALHAGRTRGLTHVSMALVTLAFAEYLLNFTGFLWMHFDMYVHVAVLSCAGIAAGALFYCLGSSLMRTPSDAEAKEDASDFSWFALLLTPLWLAVNNRIAIAFSVFIAHVYLTLQVVAVIAEVGNRANETAPDELMLLRAVFWFILWACWLIYAGVCAPAWAAKGLREAG